MLGQQSEQEMAALGYEVGADAYVCVNTATTRTVLWIVARATERHHLIRENRRLIQADRHRLQQEQNEAQRMLGEQRALVTEGHAEHSSVATPNGPSNDSLAEPLKTHYRELLRAHVIMGSGNLSAEMGSLAEMLSAHGVTAPQTMNLHVQVLEELVRGLGNRSARHVMTRADLLLLEVLVHLSECYRRGASCAENASAEEPVPATRPAAQPSSAVEG